MQPFHRATKAQAFFRLSRLPRLIPRRQARSSSSSSSSTTTAFTHGPAPPRLAKEDQDLYEKLQRSSTGAFSTPTPTVVVNPAVASDQEPSSQSSRLQINQSPHDLQATGAGGSRSGAMDGDGRVMVEARGEGEELHPDVRRGARPDFEGERNPKTGEVGGPKNEPLRWGGGVDWSYNGRVTDF